MNWLAWQQHKKQFLVFGLLLAAFATLTVPTGLHMWDTYQHALATCASTDSCGQLTRQLFTSGIESYLFLLMKVIIFVLPVLLGMFWGVPLIAREYADGTNLLVWTQSVSRRRWLTVKFAWVLTGTVLIAGGFALLATWWSRTGNALYLDKFLPLNFGTQGLVPVAVAVSAVTLSIALGAWLKRTFVALALTLAVLVTAQVAVAALLRPHYMTPTQYTAAFTVNQEADTEKATQPPAPPHAGAAWVINGSLVNRQGQTLDWTNPPHACVISKTAIDAAVKTPEGAEKVGPAVSRDGGPIVKLKCLASEGYEWRVTYQPADRYWTFQWIESGIYLCLAIAAIAVTYRLVLRRDA